MAFKVADLLVQVLQDREESDKCDQATCMFGSQCHKTNCDGRSCIMASLCDQTQCGCTLTQGTGCIPPTEGDCAPLASAALDLDALREELRERAAAQVPDETAATA